MQIASEVGGSVIQHPARWRRFDVCFSAQVIKRSIVNWGKESLPQIKSKRKRSAASQLIQRILMYSWYFELREDDAVQRF